MHRIGHGHGCRVRERALGALKMMVFFLIAVIYSSSTIHNSTIPAMYSLHLGVEQSLYPSTLYSRIPSSFGHRRLANLHVINCGASEFRSSCAQEVNVLVFCAARLRSRIICRCREQLPNARKGREDVPTWMRTRPDDDLYLLDGPHPTYSTEANKRDDLGKEADFLLSLNRAASRTRRSN